MEKPKISVTGSLTAVLLTVSLMLSACGQTPTQKGEKAVLFMDKYQGPAITLSGRVIFPDYMNGKITIFASRRYRGPADIILAEIPGPGGYSVKIPKDLGNIHIRARPDRDIVGYTGRYRNNPLKIGSSDINGVDLLITQRPFLLMDFYQGPTVFISGKVVFPESEKSEIAVLVSSKMRGPTDIALLVIPCSGEYTIKVPKNFGNLYLQAKTIKPIEGMPLTFPAGRYKQNPLKVGASDIKDIDVIFEF